MNPGDPTTRPAWVSMVDSTAREMPKSMTRGPSSASRTLDGLRSRCTTPAAWIALRLSARPAASASSDASGSGPCVSTASASEGPGTYAVAIHATGPSTSASTTWAVNTPLTRRAAATSRPNRARNSGSAASSARMAFTATGRPPGETPRNTRPMPPWPSCPTSRYGPIACGSSGCSSLTKAKTPTTYFEFGPFSLRSRQNHDKYVARERTCPGAPFWAISTRVPSSPGRVRPGSGRADHVRPGWGRAGRDAGRRLQVGRDGFPGVGYEPRVVDELSADPEVPPPFRRAQLAGEWQDDDLEHATGGERRAGSFQVI